MSARSLVVASLAGGTLALVVAVACVAAGLSTFSPGLGGTLLGAAIAGVIGAAAWWVVRLLQVPAAEGASIARGRLAAAGALLAAVPFVLLHDHPLGFLGLNALGAGAGPLGELVLVTLPLVGTYAGACAYLFASGEKR